MNEQIALIAGLIGDKSRAALLTALMTGQALTAGELARYANISAQTASNHLSKLSKAELIKCEAFGRHRYYSLYSSEVASILEQLSLLAPKQEHKLHIKKDMALLNARTCYDHIAGKLGVKLCKGFLQQGILLQQKGDFIPTEKGRHFFQKLGIDCDTLEKQKRQFLKPCLDFSERRYHLAGSLASALLDYFLEERLVIHSKEIKRALIVTQKGKTWLNMHSL